MAPLEGGYEQPSRRRRSLGLRLASSLLRGLTRLVRRLDGSSKAQWGRDPYLQGPFAPVSSEVEAAELQVVEGALPAGLEGAFARIGPNPKFEIDGGYHWFDGDGMAHVVRFQGSRASYSNRWVATARLAQEERAGWALGTKIGDLRGLAALGHVLLRQVARCLCLVSDADGISSANTALAFHGGRLLALQENDLPYALRMACSGVVQTIGRVSFGGKVQHPFTAHPKTDPDTGELFFCGYSVQSRKPPYCWYGWLDPAGNPVHDFPVPLIGKAPVLMHDMGITQQYVLLLDMPLEFDLKAMLSRGTLPFALRDRPARIGVLPRYARCASQVRWFEVGRFFCFHVAASWEEGPATIRLFLCAIEGFALDKLGSAAPYLTEIVLDLDSGTATSRRVPGARHADFPVVPPNLVGRPARYVYLASQRTDERGAPQPVGFQKYDLLSAAGSGSNGNSREGADGNDGDEGSKSCACSQDGSTAGSGTSFSSLVGEIRHGEGWLGGEAAFVPKQGAAAEDDGYLLTYVTHASTLESRLVIYDAATMSSTPICCLRLPATVPLGFHATWVTEAQLQAQAQEQLATADSPKAES